MSASMFDELAAAVEGLEIPADLDALAEVLWVQDRLSAKLSEAVGRVDQAGLYDEVGAAPFMVSVRAIKPRLRPR